jgi:hypothetical protein
MGGRLVFLVSQYSNAVVEPYLGVSQESPIVGVFLCEIGVIDNYPLMPIFGNRKFCCDRGRRAAREMAYYSSSDQAREFIA